MSVVIKGFEMPESCDACRFYDDNYDYPTCIATGHSCGYNWSPFNQRMPDCPLIEVPEPHGRLIDVDEISEHKYATLLPYRKEYADGKQRSEEEVVAFKFGWNNAIDAIIANAPTVIPASEEKT